MNKKLLGVLGVAALLLAGNFAWQEVKEVDAAGETKTIYFNPNGKETASAWFQAWTWGGSQADSWVTFIDSDGDGTYEGEIYADRTGMKMLRKSPSQTAGNWDNWNESGDLSIPTDGKNRWTWSGSGDWSGQTGAWDTYTPPVGYVENILTLTGSMQGWNPADENYKFTDENEDHVYNYSLELAPGQHKFKIVKDLAWGTEWGYSSLTRKGVSLTNDGDDNCVLNTLGGTYDFEFDFTTKTLTITQVSHYSINEVFAYYYGEGTYTKDSVLNTNAIADSEVAKYFHASADTKYRKTVYEGNTDGTTKLTMTTSEDGNTYSTKKSIYENGTNCVVHSGEVGGSYSYSTDTIKTVEDWFVTLYDFKNSSDTNWTFENGIYSYSLTSATAAEEHEMTRMAREFVAPMWLAPNSDNWAYARFTKLTVEANASGNLVMKLFVENASITDNSDGIFSQVTIY